GEVGYYLLGRVPEMQDEFAAVRLGELKARIEAAPSVWVLLFESFRPAPAAVLEGLNALGTVVRDQSFTTYSARHEVFQPRLRVLQIRRATGTAAGDAQSRPARKA